MYHNKSIKKDRQIDIFTENEQQITTGKQWKQHVKTVRGSLKRRCVYLMKKNMLLFLIKIRKITNPKKTNPK